jgi:cytoskeletal protein CcmA (bactofilin family)
MASSPALRPQFSTDGGSAALGKAVVIKGSIQGNEDLTIDGNVEGTIDMKGHRLTIGPSASVRAGIHAREVVIFGTVHGKVETTDKIEIRKEATLVGDIRTARVVIEDGAYFKGAVDITRGAAQTGDAKPATANPSGETR